jgi:hypothetical protein
VRKSRIDGLCPLFNLAQILKSFEDGTGKRGSICHKRSLPILRTPWTITIKTIIEKLGDAETIPKKAKNSSTEKVGQESYREGSAKNCEEGF